MLTFGKLGLLGNLGNQLFQIASTIGLAKKHGYDAIFPPWQYSKFFKTWTIDLISGNVPEIKEKHYHFHEWDIPQSGNYSLKGWLQSEKYWVDSKEDILALFDFTDDFKNACRQKFTTAFLKPTIAISIRRGDYVGNPNYELLPASYYYLALLEHFPDWRDYNLFFFSDDIPYCKIHFECLDNAFFADNCNAIEQLCIGSMCDHAIIANSTFSWWMAYLQEGDKVIRPAYLFAGDLLKNNDFKDFYPEEWTVFDHKGKKLDLRDTTFTIPVHHDHTDRKQNLDLAVCMLQRDFDTNIIVGEQGSQKFEYMSQWAKYLHFDLPAFHRTRMLNEMAMMADTSIVVNYDADVFLPAMQVWLAAERIRNGEDVVYPYDGRFARVPRQWFRPLEKSLDLGIFQATQFKGKHGKPLPVSSVGGAVMFNKESFIEGGMENEYMISYAPEDCERWDRFHALGYKVSRIQGSLYHLDHWCGPNSSSQNPLFRKNHEELNKIRAMKQAELRKYIEGWPWVHMYCKAYYDRISPSAIVSAKHVYSVLIENDTRMNSIIDIGCGVGEWNREDSRYIGVDYKVPKKSLLIAPENYYEYDLTSGLPFPVKHKFDLVLCLEVLEHISEQYAKDAIQLLCSLGDRILFSAAIPGQGGVGHIHERWQSYWADHFREFGFGPAEWQPRDSMHDVKEIEVWYKQNIVLYEKGKEANQIRDFVHPQMWKNVVISAM